MGGAVGSSLSSRICGIARAAGGCGSCFTGSLALGLPGALVFFAGMPAASASGPALKGATRGSLTTGTGEALALGFRRITFLGRFILAAALVLTLAGFLTLLVVFRWRPFPAARRAFLRGGVVF